MLEKIDYGERGRFLLELLMKRLSPAFLDVGGLMAEIMATFGYENLEVIGLARKFCKEVYQRTGRWPASETAFGGLGHQARRAAVSVCLNIVEGSSGSKKEFASFVRIAARSLVETRECFVLAVGFGYEEGIDTLETDCKTLYFKLIRLREFLTR